MEYEAVKQDLRLAYDSRAEERESMGDAAWKRVERVRFAAHLRAVKASSLLEIGAGHGVSGRYFADEGLAVTCVDLSAQLVGHCRAKGLTAEVMDFAHLEFDDGAFDAVFAMNCLLHVPGSEIGGILAEVRRVIAPGGLFYWGQYGGRDHEEVWEHDTYEPKRFFSFMTAERIAAVASEHFEVLNARTIELGGATPEFEGLILRRP